MPVWRHRSEADRRETSSVSRTRVIEVVADWAELGGPRDMGVLTARTSRGKEVFSFEYAPAWLSAPESQELDPMLSMFVGPQFPPSGRENFGLFLDSSPDRWGRMLMRRREAVVARAEGREEQTLLESDYLLGVHDLHRLGAIRFRIDGAYLDNRITLASPPWTSLRELEQAARKLEEPGTSLAADDEKRWLQMLIAPGGSLGGARPKASVIDETGHPWVAKFPSDHDDVDIGAWEAVVHDLAMAAGVAVPEARVARYSRSGHTFLSKRFDRGENGERIHMASALTLLVREDGDDATTGASYLELAELLIRHGANTEADLEQLWTRIVFNICVSNTDDHLRNHAFLLTPSGWRLSPAYDMNPNPNSYGLKLNISETDNSLDLGLAFDVSKYFRVDSARAEAVVDAVIGTVKRWRDIAATRSISSESQERMKRAFRIAGS